MFKINTRHLSRLPCHLVILVMLVIELPYSTAQDITIDSLKIELTLKTTNKQRLDLLNQLVTLMMNVDLEEAILRGEEALELSQKLNDEEAKAIALKNMGEMIYETPEREPSIKYFEKSLSICERIGLNELAAMNLMSIAKYHRYTTYDSTKTVVNFLKSAELSKKINFHYGAGRSYAKLASFYTRYNSVALCEEYLEEAAKYYMLTSDGPRTISHYYNEVGDKLWSKNPRKSMDLYFKGNEYTETPASMVNLAKAHTYIGDTKAALSYLQRAIPILYKTESKRRRLGLAIALLADVYIQLEDYNAADKACEEGIGLIINLGRSDQNGLPDFYRIKGIISEQNGDRETALQYYEKSLDEAIRIKFYFAQTKAYWTIGNFYISSNTKEAKKNCTKAYEDARKRNQTNIEIQACDCLQQVYKAEKSYLKAIDYNDKKMILKDSLSALKVKHAFDVNYKINEKDKLIAEQKLMEELNEKELKNQYKLNTILIGSIIIGLLLIGFLSKAFLRIRRQNTEINEKTAELVKANLSLAQSNEELERFAHVASHDLKSPLRSIISFSGLVKNKLKKENDNSMDEYLSFIQTSANRMNQLIADILQFSKISTDDSVEIENVDLNHLLNEISELSKNSYPNKKIIIEISDLPHIQWYYSKLFMLFKNIIENGIKYNESIIPKIKVYHKVESGVNTIYISDNGIGIKEEYYEKIFSMFGRLHNQKDYEGSGLGLATCKKVVDEFNGNIVINSQINIGTTFKFEIPNQLISNKRMASEYA